MAWINFKELREKLDFEQVLQHYEVKVNRKGDQHLGQCPLPGHKGNKNSPSFSANLKKGIFRCFVCGAKGNLLEFAAMMSGADVEDKSAFRAVALELNETFCSAGAPPTAKKETSKPKTEGPPDDGQQTLPIVVNEPLDFELKGLDAGHPYLSGRGFSKETVGHFGLGFCSKGYLAGRIAIPLHTEVGKLVGYAGRIIDDAAISQTVPKYKFPAARERKGTVLEFKQHIFLYNAHRINVPVHDLVVVADFPSVWWLHQAGVTNAVALMGSSVSDEQAEIILRLVPSEGRIWIMPNGNEVGDRCAKEEFVALSPKRFVRWVKLKDGKQATDYDPEVLRGFFPSRKEKPALPDLKRRFEKREITKEEAIVLLAESFPSLRTLRLAPESWDAEVLDRRASRMSSGERHAVQFLLHVWNPMPERQSGIFDALDAVKVWDKEHREAFIAWANDPWWP